MDLFFWTLKIIKFRIFCANDVEKNYSFYDLKGYLWHTSKQNNKINISVLRFFSILAAFIHIN